jgi:hypothetical protein
MSDFLRIESHNRTTLINVKYITTIHHLYYDVNLGDCYRVYTAQSNPYPYYDVCSETTAINKIAYNKLNKIMKGEDA